ncbi:MAG: methylglyoxal synthase [Candidatus Neomarinimicrobiota bacterium]
MSHITIKKIDMVQFCVEHYKKLKNYELFATDGTANAIRKVCPTLKINRIGHGPDGGDVHISYNILEDKFDALLFFIDTQTAHGHEHDIQTLIRTCATKNVPFALNTSTARIVIDGLKQTLPK